MSCRIQPAQFDPGVRRCELPLHPHTALVAVLLPAPISRRSTSADLIRRSRHCRASTDSSISAMFSQLPCFGVWWISSFSAIRRACSGGNASYSEAVLRLLVHLLDQPPHHLGKVHRRPPLGHLHRPPPEQRHREHEQVGRPAADVLVVVPLRPAGGGRDRFDHFADELLASLVEAYQRLLLVAWPVVDLHDVLHRRHESGIRLRREAPPLLQVRLQFAFFIRTPQRPVGDRGDDLQLDELVGQQPHRPGLPAAGRL